ncbi:MAG: murein biosynthesis integral membrane protein MurJ [Chromatiales bacterium]
MNAGLFRSAAAVGQMTLISRILGFVRDMVLANLLGASYAADAFFVAFRIPNFLRRLFAEGAFSQAFIPVLAEYRTQRSHGEVKALVDRVAGTLAGILFLVTTLSVFAAPLIVIVFAPGFTDEPEKFEITATMLRITFPYLLFISIAAFLGAILNTYGRFGVPAFTPVLLNLCLIGAAIFVSPYFERPVVAVAWGVFLGGLLQLGFQLPFVARLGLLPRPRFDWHDPGVRRILLLMGPAIFAVSVSQINLMVDTLLASFLPTGSVSWLYYSERLLEFPLGIFGIALGTVILPHLSERHAQGSTEQFSHLLDWSLRWVFLITVPAAIGLTVLAGPMLATLFQYGEMTPFDVEMSMLSLTAYAPGLIGFTLVKVLAPAYFARQDMRTPVRIGVICMVSNIAINLIVIWKLRHAGLALATSLSGLLNAALLYYGLRQSDIYTPGPGWGRLWLRLLVASAVMTAVVFLGRGDLAKWIAWGAASRAEHLALWIAAGMAAYWAALWLLGVRVKDMTAFRAPV